ncbi:MAG: VOC family protein [Actinomycetota bacterium]
MKGKIGLVTLGVRDLAASRAFYEALGWRPQVGGDADAIAFFPLEGTWLALFPVDDLADDAGVANDGTGFPRFSLAHNEPSAADVDRVYAEALAAGGREVRRPHPTAWGGYSGYFADPDGFLWELAWNPFTDLT